MSKVFFGLFFVVLLLFLAVLGIRHKQFYRRLEPVNSEFQPLLVRVRADTTLDFLADRLLRRGLIKDKGAFVQYMKNSNWQNSIKSGDYEFSPNFGSIKIAEMLHSGEITHNWITIPEGLMLRQLGDRFQLHNICNKADFLKLAYQPKLFSKDIKMPMPAANLEGFLFPGTYRFPPGFGAENVIKKMLMNFEEKVYIPNMSSLNEQRHSLEEVINVAAMIEREAMYDRDRPIIASVIYNRLSKNMALDIDATIQYAIGDWKHRLTRSDMKINSAYNTYRYKGLPVGPICNPGMRCIIAALHPTHTEYLYYVAMHTGYHKFTKSYAEHLQAIKQIKSEAAAHSIKKTGV